MTKSQLSSKDIDKISLGFTWNPDMSFEEFLYKNKNVDSKTWDLIQQRYITFVYEEN